MKKKEGSRKSARPNAFQVTRQHHSTETAEDYCELILDILDTQTEARIVHIAERLKISHVTAIRTIQRLQTAGYLKTSPRKPVVLTAKGRKTALFAKERHVMLVKFLMQIGVPREIAEIDVEGAEHHFSRETLGAIRKCLAS